MRSSFLAVAGLFLAGNLFAQQPPAAPPAAPAQPNRLDTLLQRWEQEMGRVSSFAAELTRTSVDKTYGRSEVFVGVARYMKPNLASLELQKKGKPDIYEKILCSGTFVYQYVPRSKVINVFEMPPHQKNKMGDDNLLSFLFGMKAVEAKKRYGLKVVKEDDWYVYVEVLPRLAADKADFQKARLVLNRSNFLPRQVWLEQPNGNEVTWDLPKITTNIRMNRSVFAPPAQLPEGWSFVKVPRAESRPRNNVPPRVVRPNR